MKCAKEDETLKEGKAFAVVKEHLDMDEEMKPLCQIDVGVRVECDV